MMSCTSWLTIFLGVAVSANLVVLGLLFLAWRRVVAVDLTLTNLCMRACSHDMGPVLWRAWHGRMGDMSVSITAQRWTYDHDPDDE